MLDVHMILRKPAGSAPHSSPPNACTVWQHVIQAWTLAVTAQACSYLASNDSICPSDHSTHCIEGKVVLCTAENSADTSITADKTVYRNTEQSTRHIRMLV